MKEKRCLIFLTGARLPGDMEDDDITICADAGILPFVRSELYPDHLVGDMDSIPSDMIDLVRSKGTDISIYPVEKDLSDGEIALLLALSKDTRRIEMYGGKCGRADHLISSVQLLSLVPVDISASLHLEDDEIILLREGKQKRMRTQKKIISILASSPVSTVSIKGLKWELQREEISFGSTRCIHNENLDVPFTVSSIKGDIYLILSDEIG